MTMNKLTFSFVTLALAAASAASYDVKITSPVSYGVKKLNTGQYNVEVSGDKAMFKKGKQVIELPVVVEEAASKYDGTQVNSSSSQLREIHVGGTKVKLIFHPDTPGVPAGGSR